MKRKIATTLALISLLGFPVTIAQASAASTSVQCSSDGIIQAADLRDEPNCNAHAKYIDTGSGLIGKPAPGEYISMTVDTFKGDSPTVTVLTDSTGETSVIPAGALGSSVSAPEKLVVTNSVMTTTNCGASNYFTPNGYKVQQPYDWYYNPVGEPASNSLIRIGEGFQTWQSGANRCNSTIVPNGVATSYKGTTTDSAAVIVFEINNAWVAICPSPRPAKQVVAWGDLHDIAAGVTCHYGAQNTPVDTVSNIMFNTSYSWYTTYDQTQCSNQVDLKGTATHEEGHALGLEHYNHVGQVMRPTGGACEMNMRGLGYGDVHGIASVLP